MILNAYRFGVCLIMAFHGWAWLNYMIFGVVIPMSTAAWATALTVLFLFERLYISIRMEDEARYRNAGVDQDQG